MLENKYQSKASSNKSQKPYFSLKDECIENIIECKNYNQKNKSKENTQRSHSQNKSVLNESSANPSRNQTIIDANDINTYIKNFADHKTIFRNNGKPINNFDALPTDERKKHVKFINNTLRKKWPLFRQNSSINNSTLQKTSLNTSTNSNKSLQEMQNFKSTIQKSIERTELLYDEGKARERRLNKLQNVEGDNMPKICKNTSQILRNKIFKEKKKSIEIMPEILEKNNFC